jgi:hypothetical protein
MRAIAAVESHGIEARGIALPIAARPRAKDQQRYSALVEWVVVPALRDAIGFSLSSYDHDFLGTVGRGLDVRLDFGEFRCFNTLDNGDGGG